ncbi:16S rRNA (guanine(527)-N(7))-methyltransferase RsmG [Mesobacterium sp. TK19101]|uniref:Ribosomal RNA small subunit methyltransferase G n=1 Tax=Mesobacterium hydrothermale TaxID=3111907 RepID=A0ABU6HFW5_9RHOB|nr:16S rRNA (guanine(527)-N(7))-methyltransferase RsmG [Mesobacterium sp. TK19101]MEC3861343.1 16S rRNA (guanine(527)-N(7))-methyltransferase RsmG [Mesobacterium sp. TK19101]
MTLDGLGMEILASAEADKLERFQSIALKWNEKINLVSPVSAAEFWERHIVDSVQVFHVKQDWTGHYVDLGSGGGLPGLVCSILKRSRQMDGPITLVESDTRKATFLRTVNRELELEVVVVARRIEVIEKLNADILTARALAPLPTLLGFAQQHLSDTGAALFPKGASWQEEVTDAQTLWSFDLKTHQSHTNPDSRILEIEGISRV